MMNDDMDLISDSMECLDDVRLVNDEWGADSSIRPLGGEVNKKQRLYDLLEDKKLRYELDDYDSYPECTAYDDDIFSQSYSAGSEDLS
jgi:hypothetical protein